MIFQKFIINRKFFFALMYILLLFFFCNCNSPESNNSGNSKDKTPNTPKNLNKVRKTLDDWTPWENSKNKPISFHESIFSKKPSIETENQLEKFPLSVCQFPISICQFPNDSEKFPNGNSSSFSIDREDEQWLQNQSSQVLSAVVSLEIRKNNGRNLGTGVLIKNNFLYTAAHVINGGKEANIKFSDEEIILDLANSKIEVDFENDLARIKIDEKSSNKIKNYLQITNNFEVDFNKSKERFFSIGYWWNNENVYKRALNEIDEPEVEKRFQEAWTKNRGKFVLSACMIVKNYTPKKYGEKIGSFVVSTHANSKSIKYVTGKNISNLIVNKSVLIAGCSGCPVFNEKLEVIGLHVAGCPETDGNMFRLIKNPSWEVVEPYLESESDTK